MTPSKLQLSRRVADLAASPIREILAVIDRPGMVSFAGGLPSADSFPDVSASEVPKEFLQYGPTEGEPELRAAVAEELRARGLDCAPDQVFIVSGSQQGIDLVAKLFIDNATAVAVESPTYLAALQVFRFFGARLSTFEPGAAGDLEAALGGRAFAYAIPNFQNPTGRCYSVGERKNLARACDKTSTPLFEDDPYRDLVYDACDTRPVCADLERAAWVYQGSFSKSIAPGLRLGYLACSPDLIPYVTRLKQAADLHSNRLSQWLVLKQLRDPSRHVRIATLCDRYRDKRDLFERALARHFRGLATWISPPGGLFFWLGLTTTTPLDTRRVLSRAIEQDVVFMPGEPFFPLPIDHANALRLNFSHADADQVERGLATLARLLREAIAAQQV